MRRVREIHQKFNSLKIIPVAETFFAGVIQYNTHSLKGVTEWRFSTGCYTTLQILFWVLYNAKQILYRVLENRDSLQGVKQHRFYTTHTSFQHRFYTTHILSKVLENRDSMEGVKQTLFIFLLYIIKLTPFSSQSGMSSFKERGSIHAPERMCAPT